MEYKSPIDNLRFSELCKALEKIRNTLGKQKLQFLSNLFKTQFFKKNRQNSYSLIRLICPKYDLDRENQNMQKHKLAKLISQCLNLSKENSDRLIHFDKPAYQLQNSPTGDFFAILEQVIYKFFKQESIITILEVNQFIDNLASLVKEQKIILLAQLINKVTITDFIFICRIILKDLQLGLSLTQILKTYHPQGVIYYNANVNLKKVCIDLADESYSFQNKITPFMPIKPMLAGRKSFQQIKDHYKKLNFFIEQKYDGERIQCHINNQKILFFSRRANDVTNIYQQLSQIIRQNVKSNSAIFDGEMITVHKETFKPAAFGHNRSIAQNLNDPEFQLCYVIYDILYTDLQPNLNDQSLKYRKRVLEREVTQIDGSLEIIITDECNNYQEIQDQFEKAVQNGQEGIIIKQSQSQYYPNDRSFNWVKLKADYIEGFVDTFDLVIIGGFYGQGIQGRIVKNQINSFQLAVQKDGKFYSCVKVSSGLSDIDLNFINNTLKFDQSLNENIIVQKQLDAQVKDLQNSLILEVKCAEIIKSENPAGFTLRFPRVIKIRNDKEIKDCMTISDLQEMYQINSKMIKKQILSDESEPEVQKKVKEEIIELNSKLFENLIFYIVNSDIKREKLQDLIKQNCGQIVQNHGKHQTHIIASYNDLTTNAIKKHSPQNIINSKWIFDSVEQNQLLDIYPKYILYAEPKYLTKKRQFYDQYDISYTQKIDDLTLLLNQVHYQPSDFNNDLIQQREQLQSQFRINYIYDGNTYYIEDQINFYLRQALKKIIELNGGLCTTDINKANVIVQKEISNCNNRVDVQQILNKKNDKQ